ncbi:MAG: type II toxin-antitoxin system VapC family toxin [Saprospiraceae bacterium]
MKIIDSNIIIYSIDPQYSYLRPLVKNAAHYVSAISKVEVLGFPLTAAEEVYFDSIFTTLQIIPLDDFVLTKAVELRRYYRLKLGDSLIATSALVFNLELQTRNITDFTRIPGLKVFNPIP